MGEWTHRICERCWFDGPGVLPDGAARLPVQVTEIEPGHCCYCLGWTVTGIFRRNDPALLPCAGVHAERVEAEG